MNTNINSFYGKLDLDMDMDPDPAGPGIVTKNVGRFSNCVFRNFAVSCIAQKHDLFVQEYAYDDSIRRLGIYFFNSGKRSFVGPDFNLTDDNFFRVLSLPPKSLGANVVSDSAYFQTRQISQLFYDYLRRDDIRANIIAKNPFANRYQNNNDIYIHIRLGDVVNLNPGLEYYLFVLDHLRGKRTEFASKVFVSSDSPDHIIVMTLVEIYGAQVVDDSVEKTMQFASTCKYIILSHGSFSALIGYLAFYSEVFYPQYIVRADGTYWHGDMFSIEPNSTKTTTWYQVVRDDKGRYVDVVQNENEQQHCAIDDSI